MNELLNSKFYNGKSIDLSRFQRSSKNPRLFSSNCPPSRYKPRLFSLLDINDTITNSRGTSIPMQYKRLSDEENQRQFGFTYRTDKKYDYSMIRKILSATKPTNTINLSSIQKTTGNLNITNKGETLCESKTNKKNNNKFKNLTLSNNESNELTDCSKNKNHKKKKIISRQKAEKNKENLIIKKRNDRWLPRGYPEYELLVMNPKLLIKKIKNNPFAGKLPEYTIKEIRSKSDASDIFFLKEPTEKEFNHRNEIRSNDNQNSDIFNIKNDDFNLKKCSETYLFKKQPQEMYNITRESNSKWNPKPLLPAFINCPSTEYNILMPNKTNITPTKEKIIIDCDKKRKLCKTKDGSKVIETINLMNPFFRQKGLGEFIDITRNGGNNPGKDFINCYQKNSKCFTKTNGVCSTFYDSYLFYKDLCTKPFTADSLIKLK